MSLKYKFLYISVHKFLLVNINYKAVVINTQFLVGIPTNICKFNHFNDTNDFLYVANQDPVSGFSEQEK